MNVPILTFESGTGWYGLHAGDILEVAPLQRVRPVPRAPGIVAGLAEVHGRVVTLIDLDRLLESGSPVAAVRALGVVLAPPRDHLGLLVRSEVDVSQGQESTGADDAGDRTGLLHGQILVGDRLLNLLSLPGLVARVEEAIREGFVPGPSEPGGEA